MEFAYFDGDDIGAPLELLLLENKVSEASEYSRTISEAMRRLKADLEGLTGGDILFSGGDDLLIVWKQRCADSGEIQEIRDKFSSYCGRTVSVGFGATASEAMGNLRKAKLSGKDRAVVSTVIHA